ncbi:MAG: 3-oxoacyl-ACP reductase [Gammaproteobacteria bacterium]|jgi:3-oxoacyl-[acyl-carrier protein] reductase|nr:3-oxoacyl-ACP reductase [Gammaproteobacteria bacterium]|tara:strand:+ start:667 stop:1413 length:747 start_codon:yes stop_codon:yes gene_type:complete
MDSLVGKIAVVTGGGSGLGEGVAKAFSREGGKVAIIDANGESAQKVANAIKENGGSAISIQADVGDEVSVPKAFKEISSTFGDPDILVNNAGIDTTALLENMSLELWDEMIRVNLRSMFLCTREVIEGMKKKKWGRIINFSSQLAHKGAPTMVHYCASKGGVLSFSKALAYELVEYGITVNSICPGPIDTPLYMAIPQDWRQAKESSLPIGRPGRVEEVVPTVLLLASDQGSNYVGASMNMNGGDVMI